MVRHSYEKTTGPIRKSCTASKCDAIKDCASNSLRSSTHPQTTSKAVAVVFCRDAQLPRRVEQLNTPCCLWHVRKHTVTLLVFHLFAMSFRDTRLRELKFSYARKNFETCLDRELLTLFVHAMYILPC